MLAHGRERNVNTVRRLRPRGAFLFASLLVFPTFAQTPTLIRGTIIDAQTHQPIPIVNVVVKGTPYGAATDSAGHFELRNLPADLYVLEFRHVAYKKRIHVLALKPSERVTFTVELEEEAITIPEVEITSKPEEARRIAQTYASTIITAQHIESIGAKKLSDVLQSFEPGMQPNPSSRRRGLTFPTHTWVPYFIYLDGTYVQFIPGGIDNIVDVRQIEKIEISRWVGTAPNVGPGTSDRVIQIFTKKSRR